MQEYQLYCTKDYNSFNAFMAKLGWALSNLRRKCNFPQQDIALEKNQIELKGKLTV